MMTGEQIRAARERAGLTQAELGSKVGVSLRTIGNWERGASVPRNRMAAIEDVLREHLASVSDGAAPLHSASDVELLAEIARRFARGRDESAGDEHARSAPRTKAGPGPARDLYGMAARRGTPANLPDTVTGEESQDPGSDEPA